MQKNIISLTAQASDHKSDRISDPGPVCVFGYRQMWDLVNADWFKKRISTLYYEGLLFTALRVEKE